MAAYPTLVYNQKCMLWKNFHTLQNSDSPFLQPRKKGLGFFGDLFLIELTTMSSKFSKAALGFL